MKHKKLCFDYALYYINRYPKTQYELTLQLRKKWYADHEIDDTIQQLIGLNYVNDVEYTRLYISSEVAKKWKPLFKVVGMLRNKWIDKELIEDVLAVDEWELREECVVWMKKKIDKEMTNMKWRGVDGVAIIKKLQWRGYRFDLIKQVIHERRQKV